MPFLLVNKGHNEAGKPAPPPTSLIFASVGVFAVYILL